MGRFEGRGRLKTWIYAILVNLATARGVRDSRVIPIAFGEEDQTELPEVPHEAMPNRRGVPTGWRLSWDAHTHLRGSVHDAPCDREDLAAGVSAIRGFRSVSAP
jgi:DNA-directed RNA polymerase specialized sigma24 family protein